MQLKRVGPAFDRIYRKEQNENLDKIEQANATLESKMDALIRGNIDDVALQTDIEQKLNDLETQYAPQLTEVSEQLAIAEIKLNDNPVKPEDFTGTDYEKIQQTFNKAINENRPVCISKTYDIGESTIVINKGADSRHPLVIYGGGTIIKNVSGFMFTTPNISVSDIIFTNIRFVGSETEVVKVFDNGKGALIRISTNNCYFRGLDTIFYTTDYVQTIRMYQDTCVRINNAVFDVGGAYDVLCDGVLFEMSKGAFFIDKNTGSNKELFNVRFVDCCIEGNYGTIPALKIKQATSLKIDGCYFEQNKGGNIVFDPNADLRNVSINNCTLFGSDPGIPLIKWGGRAYNAKASNNYSASDVINDFTDVKNIGSRITIYNHFYLGRVNKDIGFNPSLVHYVSTEDGIQSKKQLNQTVDIALFKELLNAIDSGSVTTYKQNYTNLFNSGIVMANLKLAIRGSQFNNSSSPTAILDMSGMNKNGVVTGFGYNSNSGSDGNGAIVFSNSNNNLITFPNADYDELTIEYVVNIVSLPTSGMHGLLGCSTFNTSGYNLGVSSAGLLIFGINSTSFQSASKTINIGVKKVIQVRYSTIRKSLEMYIDGELVNGSYGEAVLKTKSTLPLLVGRDNQWGARASQKMYALNIYDRYLSNEELTNNAGILMNL